MSNKNNLWKEFAKVTGGHFIEAESWHSAKTEIDHEGWKIIFDYYTLWSGKYSTQMTRVIAPVICVDGFRCKISKTGFIESMGKLFGAEDIISGDSSFDRAFTITGTDEFMIRSLFKDQTIKDMIWNMKDVNIEISDQQGIWEGKRPDPQCELSYYAGGEIKDIKRLVSLLEFFKIMLNRLYEIKCITKNRES